MSINKKLVSAALTATTILWAVGAAALPLANAQTSTSTAALQAQIASLMAEINQITAQLNANGVSTSGTTATATTGTSYNFTSDLTIGSKGAQVTALQQFLIAQGDLTGVSAPTAYFGTLTQSALAKFQKANGISPSTGYFGPISRAYIAKMTTGTTTTTTTTTTTGTGTGTTTGTTVVAPATGLQVGLGAQPANTSLISGSTGAARVPVLTVNLTAGNSGAVTVSEIKFHKNGVLSDSSISGAYLTNNGQVVAQYNSLNSGVLDFSGLGLSIPAGQTMTLTLAIDVSGGLYAGNTASFSLVSASDVTSFNTANTAVTSAGAYPLNGNTFTVTQVTNPDLAKVIISSVGIGGTVTAGSQSNLVYASTFNVSNSKVYLQGLNFHVIGSANKGDIRNLKLVVNGTQVGATLAQVAQDGTAYFSMASSSATLNTGNNNIQVFADVMGSPSYNFTFEILNSYDVLAVDSQYSVPVSAGSDSGHTVTIQQGQITVSQDASTPSGSSISKGQAGMVLAKFDIYAAGEAVKVKWLPFSITLGGTTSSTVLTSEIQNVQITDDAGGQVGTTINLPYSSSDLTSNAATWTNGVYTSSFGSSASPINYTVPANTTRVLSLKADIQSSANFSTILAQLNQPTTQNLQGMISSQLNTSSGAQGNSLTLVSSSLTVTQDSSLGSQTVAPNSTNQVIGSYAFTASQAEGVTISNLSVGTNVSSSYLSNLKVFVNGAQFGSIQPTVSPATLTDNTNSYSFSGTPFTVPMGQTVLVKVYADVLSNASGNLGQVTKLASLSGQGTVSYSPVSLTGIVYGQNLTVSSSGSSVTVSINTSNQPSNGQVAMGITGNTLASFNFNETSNVEDVKLTTLDIADVTPITSSTTPSFSNLTLWNGATQVGSVQSFASSTMVGGATAYVYSFTNLLNSSAGAYIPRNGTLNLTLKGDVNSFSSGNATDNSIHTFEIATSTFAGATSTTVVAQGATSGRTSNITLNAGGTTTQTVLRTTLSFSSSALGSTSGRAKSASDAIASLVFSPSASGSAILNTVNVTFSGTAVSSTISFPTSSTYLLVGTPTSFTTKYAATSATTTANGSRVLTWNFGGNGTSTGLNLTGVTTLTLVGDTTLTNAGGSNNSVSLYANLQNNSDIQYTDGVSGSTTSGLGLPSSVLTPIQLNGVQFQTNS